MMPEAVPDKETAQRLALARRIMAFLRDIGLPVAEAGVPADSFLPGLRIVRGGLQVDLARLRWPGDLLHEAGHLAVVPAALRSGMDEALAELPPVHHGGEVEATAWAWAALQHLQLPSSVLFHEGGYHGHAAGLCTTFELGVYPGLPGLVAAGLAASPAQAASLGVTPYPQMLAWLRA